MPGPREEHLRRVSLPNSITLLVISIADRRALYLPTKHFDVYRGVKGTTNFVYSFPKTYQEVLQLSHPIN